MHRIAIALLAGTLAAGSAHAACPSQPAAINAVGNTIRVCDESPGARQEHVINWTENGTAKTKTAGATGSGGTVPLDLGTEPCGTGSMKSRNCTGATAGTCQAWGPDVAMVYGHACAPPPEPNPPVLLPPVTP